MARIRRAGGIALVVGVLVAVAVSVAAPRPASADELAYKGCIAAESPIRPSGEKSCKEVGADASTAFAEPLNALAPSPDGRSLYSGSGVWCSGRDTYCIAHAAVGRFHRDPTTGSLDYRDCLTGVRPGTRCTEIPSAMPSALGAGLGDVNSLAVSPDGRSLYAASSEVLCGDSDYCSGSNALARFDRDPQTGAIAYRDCVTGDQRSGPSGSGACAEIPTATEDGAGSGLNGLQSVVLSPDGRSLYAVSGYPRHGIAGPVGDGSIVVFDRDLTTGALTYRGCLGPDQRTGPSGSGACTELPAADFVTSVAVSPDGRSLYAASSCGDYACYGSNALARFDRDPQTGAIAYRDCVTGDQRSGPSGSGACAEIQTATEDGTRSGLGGVRSVAVSDDGKSLYAAASADDAIARFDRDPQTGAITFAGCVTGSERVGPAGSGACHQIHNATHNGTHSGLPLPSFMALGAKSRALYVAGNEFLDWGYSSVAHFRVNPATGALRYEDCFTGVKGSRNRTGCTPIRTATPYGGDSGLHGISALATSGAALYVAAERDRDIARFALAPQTRIRKASIGGDRAVFKFRARPRSKFECKLKGRHVGRKRRHWRHCGSHGFRRVGSQVYGHLHPGRKVFKVRATDRAHTTDPTPAKRRWRVR